MLGFGGCASGRATAFVLIGLGSNPGADLERHFWFRFAVNLFSLCIGAFF